MTTKPKDTEKVLMHCSFCGKSQEEVDKLIAGPSVYICDGCVGLCNEILDEQGVGPKPVNIPTEGIAARSTESLEATLSDAANLTHHVDERLKLTVDELRDRGKTWAQIGDALGISRQAAWERFADDD